MPPRLTVGMPVYNGEPYITAALRSLATQTAQDFEVVISDNGSTDATEEICRDFARADKRFRYVRQPENQGAAWNFNEVFALGTGEYFKWAASDDVHAPTFIERCVEVLDGAPSDVGLCYPKTVLIDANGDEIGPFEDGLDLRLERPSDRFATYLRNYRRSNALFGVFRREILQSTRLHGNYVSADLVLLAEIVLRSQVWEIPDRLFYRRMHEGMSAEANPTAAELTHWFDPARGRGRVMPRTRLFGEDVRAISSAPISNAERARALAALVRIWGPRYWRTLVYESLRQVLSLVGLGGVPDRRMRGNRAG